MTTFRVAVRIIDCDRVESEVCATTDGENLNGRILDVDARDGGLFETVGLEELGLGFAAVAAFAVPPPRAVTIEETA